MLKSQFDQTCLVLSDCVTRFPDIGSHCVPSDFLDRKRRIDRIPDLQNKTRQSLEPVCPTPRGRLHFVSLYLFVLKFLTRNHTAARALVTVLNLATSIVTTERKPTYYYIPNKRCRIHN